MRYTKLPMPAAVAAATLTLASVLPAAPAQAQLATAGEVQTITGAAASRLHAPAVTFTAAEAVLVWEASKEGVQRQRLREPAHPAGRAVGLAGNDLPASVPYKGPVVLERDPAVVALEQNRIVGVWVEERQQVNIDIFYQDAEVLSSRVMSRRFDRQGRPIGRQFALSDETAGLASAPAVARLSNGRVAVVWQRHDGEEAAGIFGRLLNGRGVPVSEIFRVDDAAGGEGVRPAIAPARSGGFVVVWQACCDAGGDAAIFARSFDADTAPAGPGVQVNSRTAGDQLWPAIARGENGAYLVAWMTPGTAASGLSYRVDGRPLDPSGTPSGSQIVLSRGDADAHGAPTLAAAGDGYVVAWTSWRGSFTTGVHAAGADAQGNLRGAPVTLSDGPVGTQWQLALASDDTGRLIAAWQAFDGAGRPAIAMRALQAGD